MRFSNCSNCHKYKYIESDGLCPTCLESESGLDKYDTRIEDGVKPIQNSLIFGELASGKTFSTGLDIIRKKQNIENLNVVMIDSIGSMHEFCRCLNGTSVSYSTNPPASGISIVNDVMRLDISSTNSRKDIILTLMEKISKFSKKSDRKVLLYIDDAYSVLQGGSLSDQNRLIDVLSKSRSRNLSVNMICKGFPGSKISRNFSIQRFHKHSLPNQKMINQFNLSNKEVRFIRNAKSGRVYDSAEILIKNSFKSDSHYANVKPRTKKEEKIRQNH